MKPGASHRSELPTQYGQVVEERLGVAEDIQLTGVLAGIRLLHINNLQAEVISQLYLPVLPHQQSSY